MKQVTAKSRWTHLDGVRSAFIDRCQRYSQLTLRKLCSEEGYDQNTDENKLDWQSIGATLVNHIANKLMLTMFSPSRPNFRLEPTEKLSEEARGAGLTPEDLGALLSQAERKAMRVIDKNKVRPKLYEILKHLVVTGNALLRRDGDIRAMGIKNYCVRRSISGRMIELVIREQLQFDELEEEVQDSVRMQKEKCEEHVEFFIWVKFQKGKYYVTQWVDDILLPEAFNGNYTEEDLPYHALTWDLSDRANYGTGLVEEYSGELEALSTLSEAMVQAAVLASEYRWLLNPAGATNHRDLMDSENGAVLPGVKGDLEIIAAGKVGELEVMLKMSETHVNRLGRGFLMSSAVTRNAERVTAEEVRMMANELETGHGGVYSRLSIDLQEPLVKWELKQIDLKLNDKDIEPIIITGLDALSRNADLENLKLFLADCEAVNQTSAQAQGVLRIDAVFRDLATGRGLDASKYVKSQPERTADSQAAVASVAMQEGAVAAAQTAGAQVAEQQ